MIFYELFDYAIAVKDRSGDKLKDGFFELCFWEPPNTATLALLGLAETVVTEKGVIWDIYHNNLEKCYLGLEN